jgi:gamma-glutamylcyclotransferase (GGCT)/AIG2-like uncharacterized protein YtfP
MIASGGRSLERVRELYFAYGSNMSSRRLSERISGVQTLGPGRLDGSRMVCNKPGRDGSGKANLVAEPGGKVWGVLYRLSAHQWTALDAFEGEYVRRVYPVRLASQERVNAQAYVWGPSKSPALLPFKWYRDLLVEGAREHGLPTDYVEMLRSLHCALDP